MANGATYYYVVAAVNGGGESGTTDEAQATPVEPPPAPGGLAAAPGERCVSISWSASQGATGYTVRRSISPEGPFTTIGNPTEPRYLDKDVQSGTSYHYFVIAGNAAGRSPSSTRVSAIPTAPKPLY